MTDAHSTTPPAIYVLTRQGLELALRLAPALGAAVYALKSLPPPPRSGGEAAPPLVHFDQLGRLLPEQFHARPCHIFIAAAGIVVRCIAPLLLSKDRDPAVLVIDQRGRHVISLLSGHLGGANAMARRVAAVIGAKPVITTATDLEGLPALDCLAKEKGLVIGNLEAVKTVSAALLAGDSVLLYDPDNLLALRGGRWESLFIRGERIHDSRNQAAAHSPLPWPDMPGGDLPGIIVTERSLPLSPDAAKRCLLLHPPVLTVGVGCRRGAPAQSILAAIRGLLHNQGLARQSLICLASIDAKTDEPGLCEAAARLKLPLRFYSTRELSRHPVSCPSPKALERFGIAGVCESAALAAAAARDGPGELLAPKTVLNGVTIAVARKRMA